MKINKLISQIRSSNLYLFDDNLISDRTIYNALANKAALLVKREVNQRKLLNSDNIFTPIECLDLKSVNGTECGVDSCNKVRRSREKLPKLEEGIYNYVIQGVYNIDNSEEIYPTTIREFINLSKLRFKPKKEYYMIKNGYLYVMNPDIENVNIYVYTNELVQKKGDCSSAYEHEFRIPGYLIDSLYQMVNSDFINLHKLPKDITDNNLEEKQ